MRQILHAVLGLALVLHALGTSVIASVAAGVPEINPGSISAAVAILAGGVLMLRARRRN
jgi:hypothetical protein